jgi:hypothetical protein
VQVQALVQVRVQVQVQVQVQVRVRVLAQAQCCSLEPALTTLQAPLRPQVFSPIGRARMPMRLQEQAWG